MCPFQPFSSGVDYIEGVFFVMVSTSTIPSLMVFSDIVLIWWNFVLAIAQIEGSGGPRPVTSWSHYEGGACMLHILFLSSWILMLHSVCCLHVASICATDRCSIVGNRPS